MIAIGRSAAIVNQYLNVSVIVYYNVLLSIAPSFATDLSLATRHLAPGCSQLPDDSRSRLYSREVSELFASALAAGLESRLSGASASGYNDPGGAEPRQAGTSNDCHGQMSTLRLGGNRFVIDSWVRVLRALSAHPPREVDLSWSSVLSPGVSGGEPIATPIVSPAEANVEPLTANADFSGTQGYFPWESQKESEVSSLGELLALTVLPADAPGVEVLNLTGSRGLLLPPLLDRRGRSIPSESADSEAGNRDSCGGGEDPSGQPCSSQIMTANPPKVSGVVVLFREALLSPLCRMKHLLLSGVKSAGNDRRHRKMNSSTAAARGQVPIAGMACHDASTTTTLPRQLSPEDVRNLCEAASVCSTLRSLDISGCDLSGILGASAAAAAVACLIRFEALDVHGSDVRNASGDGGLRPGDSQSAPSLIKLSLRACRLGAKGLCAVLEALVDVMVGEDGYNVLGETSASSAEGDLGKDSRANMWPRERRQPSRFPCILDLSNNRPEVHPGRSSPAVSPGAIVDGESGSDAVDEDADLEGIATALCALRERDIFSAMVHESCGSAGSTPLRYTTK